MLKDIRKIGLNGTVYLIAALFSKGLNILLLPIYTKYLTVEEFGAVSLLLLFKSIMLSILGLGQIVTIKKTFFDYKQRNLSFKTFFSTIIIGSSAIGFLVSILMVFIGPAIFKSFFDGIGFFELGIYVLVSCFLLIPYQLLLKLFQTRNESIKFSLFEISYMGVDSIISLILIIYFSYGTLGRTLGLFYSTVAIVLVAGFFVIKEINFKFELPTFKKTLIVGLPVIPHSLSGFVLNLSDRLFLNKVYNLEKVGLYSFAYQIAQVVDIISLSIIEAWSTYFMKYVNGEKDNGLFIAKFSIYYISIIVSGCLFISIFSKEIILIFFSKNYLEVYYLIPLIALGYAMKNIYYVSNQQIIFKERTSLLLLSTSISALINILLNTILIIYMDLGMLGAAISTIISFLVMSIISFKNGQKLFYIPHYTKKMVIIYLNFIITIILIYFFSDEVIVKTIIFILGLTLNVWILPEIKSVMNILFKKLKWRS
ncbi:lipopolysaccharide biosynthesis protein [Fictibacillus halophilus]|uniref:lipopolysaccharide biosynthesis protein n=1 Tax=Fictibacillus halophilus TaxID=1610490 RepID=UPI001CFAB785|nr:oligosaccharide flippase family protein [Fictibacillus halophilus]